MTDTINTPGLKGSVEKEEKISWAANILLEYAWRQYTVMDTGKLL